MFGLCIALCAAPSSGCYAGNFKKIYQFPSNASEGKQPSGELALGADGNFYSTTYSGGASGKGTVYKVTPQGQHTLLYSFAGEPDGAGPYGSVVIDKAGNLYGTTALGGTQNLGTVFKLAPDGTETILHSFAGSPSDGSNPQSTLTIDEAGNLYGATVNGGSNSSDGTIFKVSGAGEETIIYSFDYEHGYQPQGRLFLDADGSLYGTAASGGKFFNGTAFKLKPDGGFKVLHDFGKNRATDGATPYSGLVLGRGGYFYGITAGGGMSDEGTVYRLKRDGSESLVHSFSGTDGQEPLSELVVGANGDLYGTTSLGGKRPKNGVVFKLAPSGQGRVIHNFKGMDGSEPYSGLVFDASGTLYGVTTGNGPRAPVNSGTIFSIVP